LRTVQVRHVRRTPLGTRRLRQGDQLRAGGAPSSVGINAVRGTNRAGEPSWFKKGRAVANPDPPIRTGRHLPLGGTTNSPEGMKRHQMWFMQGNVECHRPDDDSPLLAFGGQESYL
jgi:hypothetical protein